MFSLPVKLFAGGSWEVVEGLTVPSELQERLQEIAKVGMGGVGGFTRCPGSFLTCKICCTNDIGFNVHTVVGLYGILHKFHSPLYSETCLE